MKSIEKNLTEGPIVRTLIVFSLPLIAGNMLQQLYNLADTLIVGKTIGSAALAAVGSSYALMVLLTSIILGLCMGSGVVFARLYGAQKIDDLKTSIVNAFVCIFLLSLAITIIAYVLLDICIVLLRIPIEAQAFTRQYLQIIFIGMPFVFVYNFFAALLRSIGNTVISIIFLAIATIINIVLDIVFIVFFNMSVAGAAWATVVAQVVSAVCIAVYFLVKARALCPQKRHMRYDSCLLHAIISNSVLTAIQQSIMNFGILTVQGLVNSFGFAASAAFAAAVKIDACAYMPAQDFGNACAMFIAQNYGSGKTKRITQSIKSAVAISSVFCLLLSAFVYIAAPALMGLFIKNTETDIIRLGVQYLRIEGSCYIGIGILFLLYGLYRGLEKPLMSVILTSISLGSRVFLAYGLSAIPSIGITGIWWSIPIGWFLADILGIWYYRKHTSCLISQK